MFLLVVADDDGPMPQTREHLAVLRALGVDRGVVALTKIDLVDEETRAPAAAGAKELLPDAPLVEVSAQTGERLPALRAALAAAPSKPTCLTSRGLSTPSSQTPPAGEAVLHVDRVFTIAGHGTVVTGTLWSGRLVRGQRVTVLPHGREARVRSIQVHDRSLEVAEAHQRVALNLVGVNGDEVARGDVVASAAAGVEATYRLDVRLTTGSDEILREPRVQVHLGTRDAPARLVDLGDGEAQLRLERPLLARSGDRVVVRRIAPPDTLGGGVVRENRALRVTGRAGSRRLPRSSPPSPPPPHLEPSRAVSPARYSPRWRPMAPAPAAPPGSPRTSEPTGARSRPPSPSWPLPAPRSAPRPTSSTQPPSTSSWRASSSRWPSATDRPASPRSATPSNSAANTPRPCSNSSTPNGDCAATATATCFVAASRFSRPRPGKAPGD